MNFSNDQYVWLNNHSSSQRRKYGHSFVILEPRLCRSRINVLFMPQRTSLNHGSNQQKYNSFSEAVWLHHPDGNPWGFPSSEIIYKFHETKISWLRRFHGLLELEHLGVRRLEPHCAPGFDLHFRGGFIYI